MPLKQLTKEEFTRHAENLSERSFFQSVEMAELLNKRGFETEFIGLTDKDELKVSALVYFIPMTGGLHMEVNAGPLTADSSYMLSFCEALKTYAKKKGAIELLIKPYQTYQIFDSNGQAISDENTTLIDDLKKIGYSHDGLTTGYPTGEPTWHYLKELQGLDENSLLASFNKNSQRNIKKAQKLGITVKHINQEAIPEFKSVIEATGKRQGFNDRNLDYYQGFYQAFSGKTDFLAAQINFQETIDKLNKRLQENNLPKAERQSLEKSLELLSPFLEDYGNQTVTLATALIIYFPNETTYLFGGSDTAFQKLAAPFLIQYTAMKKSIDLGIPLYNFLGISGKMDGSDGVLRFKQNFNGYIVRKAGTFRYYPKPLTYRAITLLKKLLNRK